MQVPATCPRKPLPSRRSHNTLDVGTLARNSKGWDEHTARVSGRIASVKTSSDARMS